MAIHIVDNGAVTSWASNTNLVTSGSAASKFVLSHSVDQFDSTAFSASVKSGSKLAGLKMATATITTRLNPAKTGAQGLVTHSSGYPSFVRNWKMDINAAVQDSTVFDALGATAHAYLPGLVTWGGTYEGFMDSDNAIPNPGGASASATFKILENASSDHTLAGNIFIEKYDADYMVGETAKFTAAFLGDGNLTAAGSSGSGIGNPLFSSGTVSPVIGELVLTGATGRTYTGDAFWEKVSIDVAVDGIITVQVTARFTEALTMA